jgi:hypothetical protein
MIPRFGADSHGQGEWLVEGADREYRFVLRPPQSFKFVAATMGEG